MVIALCLFVLTGCYNTAADLTITAEGKINGDVTVTVPKETSAASQRSVFDPLNQLKHETIKVSTINNKKVTGRKITFNNTPSAYLLDGNKFGIKLTIEQDKMVLSGSFAAYDQLPDLKSDPVGKGKKKKSKTLNVTPNWNMKITFPYQISTATEGVEKLGSVAKFPNEFIAKGGEFEIVASAIATDSEGKELDPKNYEHIGITIPPPVDLGVDRNPMLAYIFGAMIALGIAAAVFGRSFDFSGAAAKNEARKANKPTKKESKPKKTKKK